jgi:hypothetical protein
MAIKDRCSAGSNGQFLKWANKCPAGDSRPIENPVWLEKIAVAVF